MGTKQVVNIFQEITPSFRHARKIRNDIKSHYRKNIRNIHSGRPVKTYINQSTHWLGDSLEEQHIDIEVKFAKVGEEINSGSTRISGGDRQKKYNIPDENEDELIKDIENVISGIEFRNRLSKFLELLISAVFIILTVAISLILAGKLLPFLW